MPRVQVHDFPTFKTKSLSRLSSLESKSIDQDCEYSVCQYPAQVSQNLRGSSVGGWRREFWSCQPPSLKKGITNQKASIYTSDLILVGSLYNGQGIA